MPTCFEFEVSLKYIKPRIWRRFQLSAQATFADLHVAIQDAFGWQSAHLWEFQAAGRGRQSIAGLPGDGGGWGPPTPDAAKVSLKSHFSRNQTCLYLYDFGDGWEHIIKRTRKVEEGAWRLLRAGRRSGPLEDCGGPPGYEACVAVAAGEERDEDLQEWMGSWEPDDWTLEAGKAHFDMLKPPAPPKKATGAAAKAILTALFEEPPEDEDELRQILAGVSPRSAQKALAEVLAEGAVPERLAELASLAFDVLGIGSQAGRMEVIVGDRAQPLWLRSLVLDVLTIGAPEAADRARTMLSDEEREAMFLNTTRLLALRAYTENPAQLTESLLQFDQMMREQILAGLGVGRRLLGLPASGLYHEVWQHPRLASIQPILRAVLIAEGSLTARSMLKDDERAIAQMDAEIHEADPSIDDIPAPPAAALISTCDGQGAINIFVTVGSDDDLILAGLCVRAAEGIRDSWILPEESQESVMDICHAFIQRASVRFVTAPVSTAAWLVERALRQSTVAGEAVPAEAFRAAALILNHATAAALPSPPVQKVTFTGCRKLLARREYAAWIFDSEDLDAVGASEPPMRKGDAADWVKVTARKLDTLELRRRLVGMTRYMARWHLLAGEVKEAGLCQGALVRLSGGLSEHPLVRVMLERTAEAHRSSPPVDFMGMLTHLLQD